MVQNLMAIDDCSRIVAADASQWAATHETKIDGQNNMRKQTLSNHLEVVQHGKTDERKKGPDPGRPQLPNLFDLAGNHRRSPSRTRGYPRSCLDTRQRCFQLSPVPIHNPNEYARAIRSRQPAPTPVTSAPPVSSPFPT